MATTISVLGGVGLFLLGVSVMTGGLKAMAGSRLRETLSKAAATPPSGTFWGAFVTLLVQSSSATTMTTIGLDVAHEAVVDHELVQLEHCAKALRELQPVHRTKTIRSVGTGAVNADDALAGVHTLRRLEALAHHAGVRRRISSTGKSMVQRFLIGGAVILHCPLTTCRESVRTSPSRRDVASLERVL